MIQILRNYGITLGIFLLLDMVWLLVIARDLYARQLGYLMAKQVNLAAAGIFYLLFVAGVLWFVLMPALDAHSLMRAVAGGLFFGLVTYATYDLTNMATVRDWPAMITVIDLIWGSTVSCLTATGAYLLISRFWPVQ